MGQRLLLVDSDRSFLKEHQVSLEAAFDLEVAASPDRVVSKLESGAFAAVFICVEVAENKGYALCSTIRKNAKLEGLKIVLISAKATEEEYRRHQSLKGRADLYLHKPIAPSALVAALTPLVPGRVLDPDNPLGELVDAELGDDWLDGLKNSLDNAPSNASSGPALGAPRQQPSPPPTQTRTESTPEVPPDSRHMRLLEDQIASLHEELRIRDQRILAAESEAQQVQRQLNSVTLNLDELERSNRESETLKARLAETESALGNLEGSRVREGETAETLKSQLREALLERTDLIQQVETLNHQVGEKAQRAIELLKERDRLLHETMDLEPFRARANELETTLAAREEALTLRQQELATALQAQAQLNATLEGLVEQHASLEGSPSGRAPGGGRVQGEGPHLSAGDGRARGHHEGPGPGSGGARGSSCASARRNWDPARRRSSNGISSSWPSRRSSSSIRRRSPISRGSWLELSRNWARLIPCMRASGSN
jgi:DNA-binding NarL/FixJ family response regulator